MIEAEHCVKKISGKLPNSYKRPGKMGNIPLWNPPVATFMKEIV